MEYETRHDWVRKLIHCELCKRSKFPPTIQTRTFQKNEKHKILWDFEIQKQLFPECPKNFIRLHIMLSH